MKEINIKTELRKEKIWILYEKNITRQVTLTTEWMEGDTRKENLEVFESEWKVLYITDCIEVWRAAGKFSSYDS